MNYYRILIFIALHLLLYNAHHLLPDGHKEAFRVFDTCKSAIILTAPLLLWCVPSLIGAATLFIHSVFLALDVWQTWRTGDTGSTAFELWFYFGSITLLFIARLWLGDAQLKYHRQWRINAKRKIKRLPQSIKRIFAKA